MRDEALTLKLIDQVLITRGQVWSSQPLPLTHFLIMLELATRCHASTQQTPPTYNSSALDHQGSTPEPSGAASTQTIGNPIDFKNSAIKRYLDNIQEEQ